MKTQVEPQPAPAKAPSGKKMTGADVIVEVLAQEGVDTIFGYSGGLLRSRRCVDSSPSSSVSP